jgi:hypothetical protein
MTVLLSKQASGGLSCGCLSRLCGKKQWIVFLGKTKPLRY